MSIVSGSPPAAPASMGGLSSAVEDLSVLPEMNSLRFDGSSSLSRTFGSGNRTTWTWSGWVKCGNLGGRQVVFGTQVDGSDIGYIAFDDDNKLDLNNKKSDSTGVAGNSTRVFRDIGAWYHLVIVFDGNQSTHNDRFSIYVNGESDAFISKQSTLSTGDGYLNTAVIHGLGYRAQLGTSHLEGYLANIHFVDGQALDPNSFGETISDIWKPRPYTGDYGVNGFHLDFAGENMVYDSNGKLTQVLDASSNDNHWTAH